MTTITKRWYTLAEAAEAYPVSTHTLRRAIASGALPAKRIGAASNGARVVSSEALEEWFQALPDA